LVPASDPHQLDLTRLHNVRTSGTKHTHPSTRSHGLPDVLWITRVGLDLAEGITLFDLHQYVCTTFIEHRSVKHHVVTRERMNTMRQ